MRANYPPMVSSAKPIVGHAVEFLRDPIGLLERGLHEHGKLFSIQLGQEKGVVTLGPEHHHWFFEQTDKKLSISQGYEFFQRMFDPQFYFLADPQTYQAQRKLVLPRFKANQMHHYIGAMVYETARFSEELGQEGMFEVIEKFGPLVMHVAAHAFLGRAFREQLDQTVFDDFRRFSEGMDPVTPLWLPLPKFARSRNAKKRLDRRLSKLITYRRQNPLDEPDFFQQLVDSHYEDGRTVEMSVLTNLLHLLVWAGHETTAGHISWALIDLLQNPTYLENVLNEQTRTLGNSPALTLETANALKQLEWGLKETERLHPVAFVLIRSAAKDLTIGAYQVKKGTRIFISPHIAHRLPDVFDRPEAFIASRFSPTEKHPKYSLVGFGGGLHRCSGVNFAYLEMKVILTLLLQQFHFELVDPDPQPIRGSSTRWPQSPCWIRYKRKSNAPVLNADTLLEMANTSTAAECPFDHLNEAH